MFYTLLTRVMHYEWEDDGGTTVYDTVEEVDGDMFDTYAEAHARLVEYQKLNPDREIWIAERW